MFLSDEAVQFHCPVLDAGLTVDEMLSLLHHENSGSEAGSGRAVYSVDERKRRRMISNRESARRSRWRKKKHLENMTAELNRLRLHNRELKNRVGLALQQCHVAWRENDRLSSEFLALRSRLSSLQRILAAMQMDQ